MDARLSQSAHHQFEEQQFDADAISQKLSVSVGEPAAPVPPKHGFFTVFGKPKPRA